MKGKKYSVSLNPLEVTSARGVGNNGTLLLHLHLHDQKYQRTYFYCPLWLPQATCKPLQECGQGYLPWVTLAG